MAPHRSSVGGAVFLSTLPRDGNCVHQLANYLAHDPPASVKPRQDQPIPVVRRKLGIRLRLPCLYLGTSRSEGRWKMLPSSRNNTQPPARLIDGSPLSSSVALPRRVLPSRQRKVRYLNAPAPAVASPVETWYSLVK